MNIYDPTKQQTPQLNAGAFSTANAATPYLQSLGQGALQTQPKTAFGSPDIASLIGSAAGQTQQALAQPGQAQQLARDTFKRQEAAPVKQQVSDQLAKMGDAGTARGLQEMGRVSTGLAQAEADVSRRAASEERQAALDTALKLGQLGVSREQLGTQESIAALQAGTELQKTGMSTMTQKEIAEMGIDQAQWQQMRVEALTREGWTQDQAMQKAQQEWQSGEATMDRASAEKLTGMQIAGQLNVEQLRQMSETDRQTALFGFKGTQADLDRELTREVEAGRLSMAEKEMMLKQQMQIAEFSQAEKMLGLQQNFQGTQADLDRELSREVEAGRITQQEADRASREWAVKEQINSNETLKNMDIQSQRDMFELNASLTREGWDQQTALQASTFAFEEQQRSLDRALEGDKLAQQALQFKDEMSFKRDEAARAEVQAQWGRELDVLEQQARERGEAFSREQFIEQQMTNAWQKSVDAYKLAQADNDIILRGQQLGLEGQRLVIMQQEANARIAQEATRLRLAQNAQNTQEANDAWTRIVNMASVLPPQQGAELLARTAGEYGMTIPEPADRATEQEILSQYPGDWDAANRAAMAQGVMLSPPPPGQSVTNPIPAGNATRLGSADIAYFDEARQDWVRPSAGSYVEFTNPVNAPELPYDSLPAGNYQLLTAQQISEKNIPIASFNGIEGAQLSGYGIQGMAYYVDSAGNVYQAKS
jgi:hypothetical protein